MTRPQLAHPPSSENAELHEKDFYSWAMRSAELVRQGRFDEVDRESLAEELEDMGKSERRELIGLLGQSFAHAIKHQYLLDRSPGDERKWRVDAQVFWRDAMNVLGDDPGFKGTMDRIVEEAWDKAKREVFRSFEEFDVESDLDAAGIPEKCPCLTRRSCRAISCLSLPSAKTPFTAREANEPISREKVDPSLPLRPGRRAHRLGRQCVPGGASTEVSFLRNDRDALPGPPRPGGSGVPERSRHGHPLVWQLPLHVPARGEEERGIGGPLRRSGATTSRMDGMVC